MIETQTILHDKFKRAQQIASYSVNLYEKTATETQRTYNRRVKCFYLSACCWPLKLQNIEFLVSTQGDESTLLVRKIPLENLQGDSLKLQNIEFLILRNIYNLDGWNSLLIGSIPLENMQGNMRWSIILNFQVPMCLPESVRVPHATREGVVFFKRK
jgi:hypothetical protein